jgi:SAM-dependent methyltransferase
MINRLVKILKSFSKYPLTLNEIETQISQFSPEDKKHIHNLMVEKYICQDDGSYLHPDVPMSNMVNRQNFMAYLVEMGNHKGKKILEIGSREVTGKSYARNHFCLAEYVGFDYYPGDNVDVVGDAHKLSQYFPSEEFDIIYSHAVFEHFAMPWVVALEISKCLKVGGLVFVETHFSYSSHERPWHFFQFSDMGLKCLFSPALGFECIEAGMCNPMVGRFSSLADQDLRNKPITGLYCHSDFLGRKIKNITDFNWMNVDLESLIGDTQYPTPNN